MTEVHLKSLGRWRLKTRQLALLVHLDEQRCVVRAAEGAGMTQPAASKLLREFEAKNQPAVHQGIAGSRVETP
jgi:hypothetical protein